MEFYLLLNTPFLGVMLGCRSAFTFLLYSTEIKFHKMFYTAVT
jgi:hypothetical protein